MINENEMKLEFISKSNNEAFARITVAAFVSQLDPTIEELSDIKIKIPMLGKTESLNASVATGIVLYEYVRQKISK